MQTASQPFPSRIKAEAEITFVAPESAECRVAAYDWNTIGAELDTSVTPYCQDC